MKMVAVNERGMRVGETHHRAKLTDVDVDTILELRASGLTYSAIAAKWDEPGNTISKSCVRSVCNGTTRGQQGTRMKPVARCGGWGTWLGEMG